MVTKIYNIQRVSDGKTYQADGTWAQGQSNPYDFTSEGDAEVFLATQSPDRWRLNILYK